MFVRHVANWIFPARCAGCGRSAPGLCPECLAGSRRPLPGAPPDDAVSRWFAPFAYEGAVRSALVGLKYRNDRAALPTLADAMVEEFGGLDLAVDAVTWAPTTARRRRRRGFDQARMLATEVAARARLPVVSLLRRADDTVQTGRTGVQRRRQTDAGPRFVATRHPPRTVLLVDDVATTGATLAAAARALRARGCKTVIAATAARTSLKTKAASSDTVCDGNTKFPTHRVKLEARMPMTDSRSVPPPDPSAAGATNPSAMTPFQGFGGRPVRPAVVERVSSAISQGVYDPPIEAVVDRLIEAFGRPPVTPRRR